MVLASNLTAQRASRAVGRSGLTATRAMARVSSGSRINRAGDDAAGSAVASNLDSRTRSLRVADRNIGDGLSVIQLIDSAEDEVVEALKRMRESVVQASTETWSPGEMAMIQQGIDGLKDAMDQITGSVVWGGTTLTDGSRDFIDVQVDATGGAGDVVRIQLAPIGPDNLGVRGVDVAGSLAPASFLAVIDQAIDQVLQHRSRMGATSNRLDAGRRALQARTTSLLSAKSLVEDADFAKESAELARARLMQDASTGILGQAANINQSAIRLIG